MRQIRGGVHRLATTGGARMASLMTVRRTVHVDGVRSSFCVHGPNNTPKLIISLLSIAWSKYLQVSCLPHTVRDFLVSEQCHKGKGLEAWGGGGTVAPSHPVTVTIKCFLKRLRCR